MGHKALQQLNINPWGRRKSIDGHANARSLELRTDPEGPAPKRVTIHPYHPQSQEGLSSGKVGKLITLPDSLDKLLEVASKYFSILNFP